MNAANQSDRKPLHAINEELSAEDEDDDWDDGFQEPRKAAPANDLEDLVDMKPGADEEQYYDKGSVSRSKRSK